MEDQQSYYEGTEFYLDQSPLRTVPRKKLEEAVDELKEKLVKNGVFSVEGAQVIEAYSRYWRSNIPVDYWSRSMKDFNGSKMLKDSFEKYISDLKLAYRSGLSHCYAGSHGTGKTMSLCCILKKVVEQNKYSAYYINLTDAVAVFSSRRDEDKHLARKLLMEVDFLGIDEFDQRFMGTENASNLFGRILEPIMRSRIQNKLPTIYCTNSPDVVSGFEGPLRASIKSLMQLITVVPILDKDFRGVK